MLRYTRASLLPPIRRHHSYGTTDAKGMSQISQLLIKSDAAEDWTSLEALGKPAATEDSRALTRHTNRFSPTHILLQPAMHAELVPAVTARTSSWRDGRSLITL